MGRFDDIRASLRNRAASALSEPLARSSTSRRLLLRSPAFIEWITTDPAVRRHLEDDEGFLASLHASTRFGATEPAMHVDVDVSDEQLAAAFERVRETWEKVGVDEPFWSVLSADEFKRDRLADTDAFYESGRFHVDQLVATLERHGVDPSGVGTCLEFGCGVGRITLWLAERFGHVVGCDISQPHLDLAAAEFERRGRTGVDLLRVADRAALSALPEADLVYSIIVLQHNPPPIMAFILRRLLDSLRSGGHAVLQIPTHDRRYHFGIDEYLAPDVADGILMHVLPQPDLFGIVHDAGCVVREIYADHLAGMAPHTMSNTLVIHRPNE
ncbi:MAG: class I SAM-dependent methyltransferase [Ilumatobacter sp.]|jgi:SAM-dependent methyltransferase|uniref:class I SAM-dependent methyltransferase n=1 Tax=Ilumatobacter sp. TaxID=1967498 RepID=UPI00391C6508